MVHTIDNNLQKQHEIKKLIVKVDFPFTRTLQWVRFKALANWLGKCNNPYSKVKPNIDTKAMY